MKLHPAFAILSILYTCTPGLAQTPLNLDEALSKSVSKSFDLRIAKVDTSLAQNEIKQSRVAFYPTLRAQANVEYVRSFQNPTTPIAVIGGSTIPNYTRFQEAATLSASYTAYDFGVRNQNLAGAREHAQANVFQEQRQARDLKLSVVDVYGKILSNYKGIQSKTAALQVHQEIFVAKQRLFEAGSLSKVEVAEQALKVAKTLDELNQFKQNFATGLQELSTYTQEKYVPDEIVPSNLFEPQRFPQQIVLDTSPDSKYYALEISKARRDVVVTQKQRLPQIALYSSYTFYGSNVNNPFSSLGNFNQRTVSVGLSATYAIFDGYKNRADVAKKRDQVKRLELEREQALWELGQKAEKLATEERAKRAQLETRAKILSNGKDKEQMEFRLAEQKITDKTKWLNEKIESLDRQLQVDNSEIERVSATIKQSILAEG